MHVCLGIRINIDICRYNTSLNKTDKTQFIIFQNHAILSI